MVLGKASSRVLQFRLHLQEDHNTRYTFSFFVCYWPNDVPKPAVPIVRLKIAKGAIGTSEKITVHSRSDGKPARANGSHTLAICVRPFFNSYHELHDLAHFVTYYYSIHGVQRFTFYTYDNHPRVTAYLNMLSKSLPVDYLPWDLQVARDTWEMGQLAFTQDCFYRHMGVTRYVLTVDLDEFIFLFPSRGVRRRLIDLVALFPKRQSCLKFRNVFFQRVVSGPHRPFIFEGHLRSLKIWPPGSRSKYIARPEDVIEGGIHTCHRLFGTSNRSRSTVIMDALSFHYVTYFKKGMQARDTPDSRMSSCKVAFFNSSILSNYLAWESAHGVLDIAEH